MRQTIPVVYNSGAFHPLKPVKLADGTRGEVVPLLPEKPTSAEQSGGLTQWPPNYFEQTAEALAGENFERPPQGILPGRDVW